MTIGGSMQQQSPPSRTFNLRMHTRNHHPADVVVGPRDFKAGTLIEIRQDGATRDCWIALEVGACRDDIPRDVISFEQSLATQLRLRPHATIQVRQTTAEDHATTLVELLIKEQYLSQADLWVLATHLRGSCVYVGKLIEFKGMRATVKQLWRHSESFPSGYVSQDLHQTKVVFRSASASISIFILMSREMWLYDLAGDLCFQLVVSGLLTDLFAAWHERGCTHDVTLVMATRVIYDAQKIADFPEGVRESIQQNGKGQFFEDVYEVIVQNERFDDWSDTLMSLNKTFIQLDQRVLRSSRTDLPRRRIAYSLEGPILESIDVVLNAMDTYRFDHRFDRTGHSLILVSASQGVYDVDRPLKSMTKKRVIESGLSVDLVCVLPQPFHPIPLFRVFENPKPLMPVNADNPLPFEYALSNDWINVSFYEAAYSSGTFSILENSEELEWGDRRAVAVFDVIEGDNFANPIVEAKIDMPESQLNQICGSKPQRQLLNPFSQGSSSAVATSPTDRDRSSLIHANRWLHALPHNELGQPLQVHHTRYRASTGAGRTRRPTPANEHSDIVTGVDWKSLILPAVLPSTAAAGSGLDAWLLQKASVEPPHYVSFFFPDSSPEEQQAPPILTTSNMGNVNSKGASSLGVGFKRPQKPQEVFDLLILLRLAAGFQLVLAPPQQENNPSQSQQQSIFSPSTSVPGGRLEELFKIHRAPSVLMANGRYYQKLEIDVDQRVKVTKFLRKKGGTSGGHVDHHNSVHKYPFLFSVPELPSYSLASTDFANRRPDLLNLWSSIDYHATQKTADIDYSNDYLIRQCFWKSYFAVVPLLNLPSISSIKNSSNNSVNNLSVEIDWAKIMEEMVGPSVQYSSLARLVGYMNGLGMVRPASQAMTPSTTPQTNEAPVFDKTLSHMLTLMQAGLDSQSLSYVETGISQSQQVRFYTTYDAVNWLLSSQQQQIYGYDSVEACMTVLNDCLEIDRIHALSSGPIRSRKLFYGIYYFSFISSASTSIGNRSENLVEVSFGRRNDDELSLESSVMLSVDPSGRAARGGHELAMIAHDSYFRPGCAFCLRLEWLFASGSFLCELVDSWHHRARAFGLLLLPVPSDPFLLSAYDPLRMIIEIPFDPEEVVNLVKPESVDLERDSNLVHEALLRHFAFTAFRDYFVHASGVAFIRRVPGRIEWAWNFQVSRRWPQVLEHDAGDRLLDNFRRISSNCDNALLELVKLKGVLAS